MAKKLVTIYVVGSDNYAQYGASVYTYSDSDNKKYTDSNGKVSLMLESDDTVYVDGCTAKWDGSSNEIIYKK